MRVLIVGCGYVGLPLGVELVRTGHVVFGLRRNPEAEAELRAARIAPLFADISDAASLAGLPRDFDWVVNCAATSGGTVEDYRRLYLEGTRNLLAWLRETPPRRYIWTSSTGVYGQNDGSVVEETDPTAQVAETARVFVETEKLLGSAQEQKNFPVVVLRLAGIYGPGRGYWLKQFLNGQARLDGDGARFINMIHRDDVVGVILAALKRSPPFPVYNVVDNEPVSQRDLFEWLAAQSGKPFPPSAPEDDDGVRKRGVTNKRVSNRRLREEMGYRFKYPTFREGYAVEIRRMQEEDPLRVGSRRGGGL